MRGVFSYFLFLTILVLCGQPSAGQSFPPELQVLETDPPGSGMLPLSRPLYLRIRYESSEPVRVQAEGVFHDKPVKDITNPSPVYPAGSGDMIAWISYRAATQIDEVRLTLCDEKWEPLITVSVPISASWQANAPAPVEAAWVRAMSAAQQSMVVKSMHQKSDDDSPLWLVLPALLMLSVPGYFILQIFSLKSDGWKSLSGIPLLVMIPLVGYTAFAFAMQSNLWPMLLIFACPAAFLYLLVIRIWKTARR